MILFTFLLLCTTTIAQQISLQSVFDELILLAREENSNTDSTTRFLSYARKILKENAISCPNTAKSAGSAGMQLLEYCDELAREVNEPNLVAQFLAIVSLRSNRNLDYFFSLYENYSFSYLAYMWQYSHLHQGTPEALSSVVRFLDEKEEAEILEYFNTPSYFKYQNIPDNLNYPEIPDFRAFVVYRYCAENFANSYRVPKSKIKTCDVLTNVLGTPFFQMIKASDWIYLLRFFVVVNSSGDVSAFFKIIIHSFNFLDDEYHLPRHKSRKLADNLIAIFSTDTNKGPKSGSNGMAKLISQVGVKSHKLVGYLLQSSYSEGFGECEQETDSCMVESRSPKNRVNHFGRRFIQDLIRTTERANSESASRRAFFEVINGNSSKHGSEFQICQTVTSALSSELDDKTKSCIKLINAITEPAFIIELLDNAILTSPYALHRFFNLPTRLGRDYSAQNDPNHLENIYGLSYYSGLWQYAHLYNVHDNIDVLDSLLRTCDVSGILNFIKSPHKYVIKTLQDRLKYPEAPDFRTFVVSKYCRTRMLFEYVCKEITRVLQSPGFEYPIKPRDWIFFMTHYDIDFPQGLNLFDIISKSVDLESLRNGLITIPQNDDFRLAHNLISMFMTTYGDKSLSHETISASMINLRDKLDISEHSDFIFYLAKYLYLSGSLVLSESKNYDPSDPSYRRLLINAYKTSNAKIVSGNIIFWES
eukprot:NODE_243_length_13055_cov_0.283498.p1 type:complete len:704 gc:universal NODE_243_length_13055_cov_0.283498:5335-7446(+)